MLRDRENNTEGGKTLKSDYLIFLSHPVTAYLSETGIFQPDRQLLIESVIRVLEYTRGGRVECAGVNEQFGRVKLEPSEFTRFDMDALGRCQEFIVVSTFKPSRDIYLELGVALGRGIPCSIFLPRGTAVTYMILGLAELGQIDLVWFDGEADLPLQVHKHFSKTKPR